MHQFASLQCSVTKLRIGLREPTGHAAGNLESATCGATQRMGCALCRTRTQYELRLDKCIKIINAFAWTKPVFHSTGIYNMTFICNRIKELLAAVSVNI